MVRPYSRAELLCSLVVQPMVAPVVVILEDVMEEMTGGVVSTAGLTVIVTWSVEVRAVSLTESWRV